MFTNKKAVYDEGYYLFNPKMHKKKCISTIDKRTRMSYYIIVE